MERRACLNSLLPWPAENRHGFLSSKQIVDRSRRRRPVRTRSFSVPEFYSPQPTTGWFFTHSKTGRTRRKDVPAGAVAPGKPHREPRGLGPGIAQDETMLAILAHDFPPAGPQGFDRRAFVHPPFDPVSLLNDLHSRTRLGREKRAPATRDCRQTAFAPATVDRAEVATAHVFEIPPPSVRAKPAEDEAKSGVDRVAKIGHALRLRVRIGQRGGGRRGHDREG